jgi:GNAT superfamily N-acetyltransferase
MRSDVGGIVVRAARPDDAAALVPLFQQLGYPVPVAEIRRRLSSLGAEGAESEVLVAVAADALVGFAVVQIQRDVIVGERGRLGGLVVLDGFRSAGIGAQLLEAAEAWVSTRGTSVMNVTSNVVRDGAHRFYLRHGYLQKKTQHVFEKRLD